MINVENWMDAFLRGLNDTFGDRVWFVGLQGSYGRGEATEKSDIDPVVILDELSLEDISLYRTMLDSMPNRELICGFLSGKQEILNWEPSDLFQFCNDTTAIKGTLNEVLSLVDDNAVNRAIKLGVCNIYHGCVHNMLHERSEETLCGLYKCACFVVQAIAFQQTGTYFCQQKELIMAVSAKEKAIIETYLSLRESGMMDFDTMSEKLFDWAKGWVAHND